MSGYGYGNSKAGRRERSRSRSGARGGERDRKTPKGEKKDKKDKKDKVQGRERDDRHQKRPRSRSTGRGTNRGEKDQRDRDNRGQRDRDPAPGSADKEAQLGRTTSQSDVKKGAAWREEIKKTEGDKKEEEEIKEDENILDGYVPEEDDEQVAQKLAESRARREALIAKWVTRGDTIDLDAPDTPMVVDEDEDIDVDGEDDGDRKPADDNAPKDEAALEKQRDIMKFILDQKAEHDDDNMFDETADENALKAVRTKTAEAIGQTGASADDWDDAEGYYRAKIGEVMDDRYLVVEDFCGKGVFSNVVKAKDQKDPKETVVAIKVMRANDMMRKAAEKEVEVLQKLNRTDKKNQRQVIRLLRVFSYRGHLCLAFECMWDNLRVALKKYTKDKGMSLQAVRAYSKQLLIALRHIHKNNIIHADIKPDNILISAGHNVVKICDLGSAMYYPEEVEPTPYLVSRFYRAPEIVLGAKYGPPMDVFAIGCTFFELFTGKILFPGKSNNDMLRHYMDVRGKFNKGMIKSGTCKNGGEPLWKQHFDENMDFKYLDSDKVTRKKTTRIITDCSAKPHRAIMYAVLERVGTDKQKSSEPEDQLYIKKTKQFADFIMQLTALDPDRRMSATDALNHPFLLEPWGKTEKGKGKGGKGAAEQKR